MIAAIVGSRSGLPWLDVKRELEHLLSRGRITRVVSGGALGVDRLAESIALSRNIPVTVYRPDWEKFGRAAGFRRNVQIIELADVVFAFWDGVSRGTAHSIDVARKMNKSVKVWQRGTWTSPDEASATPGPTREGT